ncbi:hypothetical protein BX600DRAFT_510339 [Xylariales sp. PMI_506]|nr:hypothetical protein BX600DRAFT_510339 [Xylariales sp. PMI_506]
MQAISMSMLLALTLLAPLSLANPLTLPAHHNYNNEHNRRDTSSAPAVFLTSPVATGTAGLTPPTRVSSLSEPTSVASSSCVHHGTSYPFKTAAGKPQVTPPPAGDSFFQSGDAAGAGGGIKFKQTTYTTCITYPDSYVHCGIHEPILDASTSAGSRCHHGTGPAVRAVLAAATAGLLLVLLGSR